MSKNFNHYWRIFATGGCFAFFGFGGLLLSLLVFPIQKLVVRDVKKQKKLARKTVHLTFKFFIGLMALSGIYSFNLAQARILQDKRGHLILANHPSLIDVVVLISIIPNVDCVVKAHLFKNPFIRGVVKNTGYISNADPEGLLNDCHASLAAGNNLIIFPEGTRTTPGVSLKFQRGAANIAVRCQAKVSTVLIDFTPSALTKVVPWYKVPERKSIFTAQVIENSPAVPELSLDIVSKQVRQYNNELESFFKQYQ
ncbi:MAG: 1-acyl-sn-glycerol-3-phosphate acyltransferase [Gammaproteobacteria bacterium]|nr:1-acyl-sn-glycerol-3-phosphate acyltransferase [Gammaproteobacteria bacterium]